MFAIFPELMRASAAKDVELLSILVRQYFGGKDVTSPKPDVHHLIKNFGAKIVTNQESYWGAILLIDDRGSLSVHFAVRSFLNPSEERFLLGHLLGVFLLKVQSQIERNTSPQISYRLDVSPLSRYEQAEKGLFSEDSLLADDFAAALLMPKGMVKKAAKTLGKLDQVALFFGVSKPCVEKRILQFNAENVSAPQPTRVQPQPARTQPQPKPAAQAQPIEKSQPAPKTALERIRALAQTLDAKRKSKPKEGA